MNYWIVLLQINPVPPGAPAPIKLNVKRSEYEVACQESRATVICDKGRFIINEKRQLTNEGEGSIYLVCDVEKLKT